MCRRGGKRARRKERENQHPRKPSRTKDPRRLPFDANTMLENGGSVVLYERNQWRQHKISEGKNGIKDSADLFTSDTLKGGAKKPELAKALCENSGTDVEWLMDKFNLDLSLVARLGGHSAPRTHRGKDTVPSHWTQSSHTHKISYLGCPWNNYGKKAISNSPEKSFQNTLFGESKKLASNLWVSRTFLKIRQYPNFFVPMDWILRCLTMRHSFHNFHTDF